MTKTFNFYFTVEFKIPAVFCQQRLKEEINFSDMMLLAFKKIRIVIDERFQLGTHHAWDHRIE